MAEQKLTVLMAHLDADQAKIWQAALESQNLQVLVESPDTELVDFLNARKDGARMPDLLLMDTGIKSPSSATLQSGTVCRWCSRNTPSPKVVLFNPREDQVDRVQQMWAIKGGAIDLLPRLYRDNLEISVIRVTSVLGCESVKDTLRQIALTMPPSPESLLQDAAGTTGFAMPSQPEPTPAEPTGNPNGNPKSNDKGSGLFYRGVRVKR